MAEKILVVEDEEHVADSIRYNLEKNQYQVAVAHDGDTALELARREKPDLIVLDLMLPGRDGLEVCRILRSEMEASIIILTAKNEEVDRIVGLEVGADDYIVKPFSMRELIARIRAILRRTQPAPPAQPQMLEFGELRIDVPGRRVFLDNEAVDLTRKEFDLLVILASQPNVVFSRDELLKAVWGEDFYGDEKTLDVHIRWLRGKIEADPAHPRFVQTVRGVGYRFQSP